MPRKARIDSAGALQYITVRGIARKRIFYDDVDRDNFVARPTAILTESTARCYAWLLISNYSHFLFLTGKIPISTFMRQLLSGYVLPFNHHYRLEFEFTPWMSLR